MTFVRAESAASVTAPRKRATLRDRIRTAAQILDSQGWSALLRESAAYFSRPVQPLYEGVIWQLRRAAARDGVVRVNAAGHIMYVHRNDKGISRELSVFGIHEPLATSLIAKVLRDGMNVVDVGGNIGYFALLEARAVEPHGRVAAFEPVPANIRLLTRNIRANEYTNIVVERAAIGNRRGRARMRLSSRSNWHSLFVAESAGEPMIDVSMVRLDDWVEESGPESVDFLRMDLEGYEITALEGMRGTLSAHQPHLLLELHPYLTGAAAMREFLGELRSHEYRRAYLTDRNRDTPWRAARLRWEPCSIEEAARDFRITSEKHAVTAFLPRPAHDPLPRSRWRRS